MENHYVYILSNKKHGTLYVGKTNDLIKRIWQHKTKYIKGFTSKYNLNKLVYYAHFESHWDAADYERKLKNWKRQWKIDLIEQDNADWADLYDQLTRDPDFRQDAVGNKNN